MSYTEIKTAEGAMSAYIAMPQEAANAPAVIMIQEIFGVNAEMREKCDNMAAQGYIAICPDLFWRIEAGLDLVDSKPEELARAFELFGLFDTEKGVSDLIATLKHVREISAASGKVGCVGYCLGGKLAYMMATHSDIDASVGYYGVAIETMLSDAQNIKNPLLLHIAGADEFVPPEAQNQIISAFADHPQITTHRYEGMDHAFARGNGMHYNASAATLANTRTADFLAKHLK